LSDTPHKKFADLDKHSYVHPSDSRALAALRTIPGIDSALKEVAGRNRRIGYPRNIYSKRRKGYAETVSGFVCEASGRMYDSRR